MKKLILILLLFSGIVYSQTISNKTIIRGNTDTLTYYVSGDLRTTDIRFTVKETWRIETPREIYKRNLTAGGDSSQINIDYSSGTSTINIYISSENTDGKGILELT